MNPPLPRAALFLALSACSSGGAQSTDDGGTPPVPDQATAADLAGPADLALPQAAGRAQWAHSYNGDGLAVAVGADGSVFFAGSFSKADFGDGMVSAKGITDVFLVKYDRAGQRLWARTFGGNFIDAPTRVAVDPLGTATVVGYSLKTDNTSSHDMLIARYAADGTQRLFQVYGGSQTAKVDSAQAVAAAADGSYYVVGSSEDALDLGGGLLSPIGTRDVIVAHYSSAGAYRWARRYGSSGYSHAGAAAVTADGDLLIGGSGAPRLDFGDGNPTANPDSSGFVARFAPTGGLRWSRHFVSPHSSSTTALANAPGGAIWAAGNFGGSIDLGGGPKSDSGNGGIFWGQFDATGKNLSTFVLPSPGGLSLNGAAVDRYGQIVLGGQADTDVDFGAGPTLGTDGHHFLMKRTADGRLRWARRFGGTGLDRLTDVALASDDGVLAVGNLTRDVTLEAVTFKPYGYVLALSP